MAADPKKEIENSLDLLRKLKETIPELKNQRVDAEAELTQSIAKDLAAAPLSADTAIARYQGWKAQYATLEAKITDARGLVPVIEERIKELKKTEEKALGSAIDRKVGELEEVIKSLKALK
jgi:DNA repair exonuclease SbcCD ATPase subunit